MGCFLTVKQQKKPSILRAKFLIVKCDQVGIRTRDRLLRRQLLYPAELPDQDPFCEDPSAKVQNLN